MTKDEALKLALEALERCVATCFDPYAHEQAMSGSEHFVNQTITAIKEALAESEPNYKKALEVWLDKTEWVQETVKPHELGMHRADVLKQRIEEALAQPEQEPVAWVREHELPLAPGDAFSWVETRVHKTPLYTAPAAQRQWVGLTDTQIEQVYFEMVKKHRGAPMPWGQVQFGKALEAKLKEMNHV